MKYFVVYHHIFGSRCQPIWRGKARNAHHAQVLAEEATGQVAGDAHECMP